MFHERSRHGLDGDDFRLVVDVHLDADGGRCVGGRVGDGNAFVGEAGHFFLGAGVVVGEADEAFDGGDGVFVVGEGCG